MFDKLPKSPEFPKMEEALLERWSQSGVIERSLKSKPGAPKFTFYEGPPTANGLPHPGHVLTRVIKDVFLRYRTMCGFDVLRKAGWDTHGLPVEIAVEKELWQEAGKLIEEKGVVAFIEACSKSGECGEAGSWIEKVLRAEIGRLSDEIGIEKLTAKFTSNDARNVPVEGVGKKTEAAAKTLIGKYSVAGYIDRCKQWGVPGLPEEKAETIVAVELGADAAKAIKNEAGAPAVEHCYSSFIAACRDSAFRYMQKEFALEGKNMIEKYGVAEFIAKCKENVFRHEKEWRRMTERVGFWVDLDDPYITCQNNYIESVWWILKRYWDEDLLYKAHKIVPHCPSCETALSSHEVAQGYMDVKDPSVFARFKIKGQDKTSFLVWTTTPWTLISNVALAFGPEVEYAKVKFGDEFLILAEARLIEVFREDQPYEVVERMKGADLAGIEYEPLFDFCVPDKKAHYAILADFVSTGDGTGIVHIAPAFGEDDYQVGLKFGLPFLQPVDTKGCFTAEVTPWAGVFVKDADQDILENLKERGILFRTELYEHSYPFCWRCDSPLIYYARSSWFLKTTAYRDTLLEVNDSINWIPDHIKKGRMGDFLVNNIDWAVSRDRYWGTPLNLWICENDPKHVVCIDSAADLKKVASDFPDGDLDLHRPYIDAIHCKCPQCGAGMTRTPEVIDCWLDSGAMPVAQWHYPHENKELFESYYPADFITEAVDQTRGWFYSLMALNSFLFKKTPFKNCLVLGHVLAEDGAKMSKHLGNVVDPWFVFNANGADAFRWHFYRENNPWLPSRFSCDAMLDVQKNFFLTLWNVYSFFVIYANLDDFDPEAHKTNNDALDSSDRWILSRLHSTLADVKANLDIFMVTPAARSIESLVDDLSNWYVRRCRPRFWRSEKDEDKWAAYSTLHTVLVTIARALAPFAPFISETIYLNLARPKVAEGDSVHFSTFPESDPALIDKDLEEAMAFVRELVNEGRSMRNKKQMKVRQPLQKLLVRLKAGKIRAMIEPLSWLLIDELNIRQVAVIDSFDLLMTVHLKPNFKKLGPKYGKDMKKIETFFKENEDHSGFWTAYSTEGALEVEIEGTQFRLEEGDLDVEKTPAEGYLVGETVALDIRVTPELLAAGRAREIVHRIQNLRKEMDLDYAARIVIHYGGDMDIKMVFADYEEYIKGETLATEIVPGLDDEGEDFEIDGLKCRVAIIAG
ncbi:MAG: isoleucine--tRNA ligase [bacterium]